MTERDARARLAEAFRIAYEHAGLTQIQLEADLRQRGFQVDQSTISKWKRGDRPIPLDALPILDALCGQPTGHILRLAGFVDDELDLRSAIRADRTLTADEQGALLLVYDQFRQRVESNPSPDPEPAAVAEFPSPPPDPWHDLKPNKDDEYEAALWALDLIPESVRRRWIWEVRNRNAPPPAAQTQRRRRSS